MGLLDTLAHAGLDNDKLHFVDNPDLSSEEAWLVALGAPLAAFNGSYINTLASRETDLAALREGVEQMWGMHDRESFEKTAQWLVEKGHRAQYLALWKAMRTMAEVRGRGNFLVKMFMPAWIEIQAHKSVNAAALAAATGMEVREVNEKLVASQSWAGDVDKALRIDTASIGNLVAWDAVRLVNVARWAFQLGWIRREEFVPYAGGLSGEVRAAYGNWSEVSAAYVIAGLVWNYSEAREEQLVHAAKLLAEDPRSPYQQISLR